jgi:hypothetical protein
MGIFGSRPRRGQTRDDLASASDRDNAASALNLTNDFETTLFELSD